MHTTSRIRTDNALSMKQTQQPLPEDNTFRSDPDSLYAGEVHEVDQLEEWQLADRKELLYYLIKTRTRELQVMLSQLRRRGHRGEQITALLREIKVARDLTNGGWQKIDDDAEAKLNQWLETSEILLMNEPNDRVNFIRTTHRDSD